MWYDYLILGSFASVAVVALCPNNNEVHIYRLLEDKWERLHVLQKVLSTEFRFVSQGFWFRPLYVYICYVFKESKGRYSAATLESIYLVVNCLVIVSDIRKLLQL